MNLPIFPLPIFLLPGGVTQLRIFEQRYINMVKNCNNTQGFAIQYQNQITNMQANWASWVDIIDFDQDDNNMLLITVKCKQLVKIEHSHQNEALLLIAEVTPKAFWQETSVSPNHQLAKPLKHIFDQNSALQGLYPSIVSEQSWLCARWLEILPLKFEQKELLIEANALNQAQEVIEKIVNNVAA